jgi:putative ABC transport system permease protein
LFGALNPVGQYVKLDEQWFRVLGVTGPQLSSQADIAGLPTQDLNNIIYVPLNSSLLRLENSYSDVRDEIDGIYLRLQDGGAIKRVPCGPRVLDSPITRQ